VRWSRETNESVRHDLDFETGKKAIEVEGEDVCGAGLGCAEREGLDHKVFAEDVVPTKEN